MKLLKKALSSIMIMFFLFTITTQARAANTGTSSSAFAEIQKVKMSLNQMTSAVNTLSYKLPYVVGAICSVTGPNAPLGIPERDTLLMLQDQINKKGGINGHLLKLIIEDDGSDNTNAVKAAKKLIEQDCACAIIGSSGTSTTMAVIPIAEASGVPLISMATGITITDPIKKWVFRTAQTDVLAIMKILDYLTIQKNIDKVAIIYDSNDFGSSGRDQLRIYAPEYNVQIVDEEVFTSTDTDMTVQLTEICTTDAQAIICWGMNPATAQVAKNAQQLGITLPLIMSHSVANQAFLDQTGVAANSILIPTGKLIVANYLPNSDPRRKVLIEYGRQFKAKYNKTADSFGGYAWDALNILIQALKKTGDDCSKLRDGIEKTTRFTGISGVFTYSATNHDGMGNDSLVMVEIKKGTWTLLKDKLR